MLLVDSSLWFLAQAAYKQGLRQSLSSVPHRGCTGHTDGICAAATHGWPSELGCSTQADLLPSQASNQASYHQLTTVQQQPPQDGERQHPQSMPQAARTSRHCWSVRDPSPNWDPATMSREQPGTVRAGAGGRPRHGQLLRPATAAISAVPVCPRAGWGAGSTLPRNHPSAVLLEGYHCLKRAELQLFQGNKTHKTLAFRLIPRPPP